LFVCLFVCLFDCINFVAYSRANNKLICGFHHHHIYIYIFNCNFIAGKPWTYKLEIKSASNLPVFCEMAYVSYDFFGESFTTEAVEQTTFSPVFDYKKIHHVPSVTPEFIKYLKGAVEMQIHVTQHIEPPMVRTVLFPHHTDLFPVCSRYLWRQYLLLFGFVIECCRYFCLCLRFHFFSLQIVLNMLLCFFVVLK
jgi:hypothetical protein